jgi:hypothetical protein
VTVRRNVLASHSGPAVQVGATFHPAGTGNNPADRACTQDGAIDTVPHLTRAVTIVNPAGQ